jgi:sodium/potassium-transporting ATPase subunit alpha
MLEIPQIHPRPLRSPFVQAYTLAHIFPEVVSAILSLLAGLPAGLTGLQVVSIDLFTEIGPAVSLAYEQAEADLMDRLPRDPLKDRLVSPVLLLYSYVTSGFIITIGCLMAYMFTYLDNGIRLSDFHKPDINDGDFFDLTASEPVTRQRDSRTFSVSEQKEFFSQGATAYYIALTMAQFCHIWVCKTRTSSLFAHGFGNKLTFYGVAVGIALVVFFCYVPGVQTVLGSTSVGWIPWVCGLAAGAVLWIYNEGSKFYFRRAKPDDIFVRLFAW